MKDKKKVIIVGGGTAGIPIANHLQDYFDVTVIEKSKYESYPWIYRVPLMIGIVFRSNTMDYVTQRTFDLPNGRQVPFYESNLWGGASVMNGAVHVFGFKSVWKKVLEKFAISYDELVKSNDELYSFDLNEENKMTLMYAHQNEIDNAFIETLNSRNINSGDMSYSEAQICGPIQNTVRNRFRTSVLSLIKKANFTKILDEKVGQLIFNENGQAMGVKTNKGTKEADYIILSAGVIGSCELMLREKNRTHFLEELPLAEDIQDHTNIRVNVLTTRSTDSLNEVYDSLYKKMLLGLKHFCGQSNVMRGTGATSAAYLDIDHDGEIDTRIQILQFAESGRHQVSNGKMFGSNKPSFSISINAIHPESKGNITLDGDTNVVNPNFLSTQKDIEILKLALKYCLDLLKSEPIKGYVQEIVDENIIIADPEKYIKDTMYSGHHLIGGLHDAVDANFELKGVKNLYVCDASIFDRFVASNIHSSVALIADLFAKKFVQRNFYDKI